MLFACLRMNRKSCLVLPLLCIFGLVIFNISQNQVQIWSRHRCQPCQCDHPQVVPYIQESSFSRNPSKQNSPTDKGPCNCDRREKKSPVLLSDLMKLNSSQAAADLSFPSNCPPCITEYKEIDVIVNGKERISGLYHNRNAAVFIPFDFLQKHYEIFGDLRHPSKHRKGVLLWSHSIVNESDVSNYSPSGPYMNMVYSSVESRDRVKCISAIEGVPVSTQWSASGYFYPTQIAQFGLSHFSKYLKFREPKIYMKEDGHLNNTGRWTIQVGASMRSVYDKTVRSHVVFFDSRGIQEDGITYPVRLQTGDSIVFSFSIKFRNIGQISVSVLGSNRQRYTIRYSASESMWVKYSFPEIYYGLPQKGRWLHLTRDLNVDLQKGLGSNQGRKVKAVQTTVIQVIDFTFHGTGWFDNITLSSSAHERLFLTAANWLVRNQNAEGGWKIDVTRKVVEGLAIKPGWYSAMSQGQAISLLCRAFNHTGNRKFLISAIDALKLFRKSSEQTGIVAKFMDKYVWYEEYPTQPPLFVLNGFMYSLIGLYDLSVTAKQSKWGTEALALLNDGLRSLEAMLPLYDNGHRTFYDLRHITLPESYRPPNRARWSYHVLHIEQLSVIRQFHPSRKIDKIAERWRKYIHGYISPHN